MSSKAQTGRLDGARWLVVWLLVALGVGGNWYFGGESLLYRVLGLVVVAILALLVALQTARGAAFWKLARESRAEIRRVVWPTRQESTQTTLIVVAFVLVMALILWGLDTVVGWLVSRVIG